MARWYSRIKLLTSCKDKCNIRYNEEKKEREMIDMLKCKRCGHEWIPRSINKPKACPGCNSRVWEKEKKNPAK